MPSEKLLRIKRKKWIERNSIKGNEGFISKVLDSYRINYEITCDCYGDCDIFISYNLQRYKIEIDIEQMSYKLLIERNLTNNPKHKNRFKLIKIFQGEDLIFDIIKYLDNINKHKKNVEKEII